MEIFHCYLCNVIAVTQYTKVKVEKSNMDNIGEQNNRGLHTLSFSLSLSLSSKQQKLNGMTNEHIYDWD